MHPAPPTAEALANPPPPTAEALANPTPPTTDTPGGVSQPALASPMTEFEKELKKVEEETEKKEAEKPVIPDLARGILIATNDGDLDVQTRRAHSASIHSRRWKWQQRLLHPAVSPQGFG